MLDTTTQSTPLSTTSSLIASLNALSTMDNAAYCRVCLSKNHKTSQCIFIPEEKRQLFKHVHDSNIKQLPARADRTNNRSGQKTLKCDPPLSRHYLPRNKSFRVGNGRPLLSAAARAREQKKLDKKSLSGAFDNLKPDKMSPTLSSASSATTHHLAREHKVLTVAESEMSTPSSRVPPRKYAHSGSNKIEQHCSRAPTTCPLSAMA